jgi:hypothetical protein
VKERSVTGIGERAADRRLGINRQNHFCPFGVPRDSP